VRDLLNAVVVLLLAVAEEMPVSKEISRCERAPK
jgi:hypothetical protein